VSEVTKSEPLLDVAGLSAGYGAMEVVHEVDLKVFSGEIVSMVGRNGAGKTTTVKAICGIREGKTKGSVRIEGVEVGGASVTEIVRRGLSLVPEGHRIFKELSVQENLRLGGYLRRRNRSGLQSSIDQVCELFPILAQYHNRQAGNLSGGEQQMVAIGQALIADPRVLVLDEPSSGLALGVVSSIYAALSTLRAQGLAVLVVEQNVERALKSSDRSYVLEGGKIAIEGYSSEMAKDPRVVAIVTGVAERPS
jgi:branched-chain amino acid transport system ATP-binding protein